MVPASKKAMCCCLLILLLSFRAGGGALGTAEAPAAFKVRLDTTKGAIIIECVREWAPLGADRFFELVTSGYYDDSAIFRIRPKTWVQFGINGDPKVSQAWRSRTFPDDPFQAAHANVRGT